MGARWALLAFGLLYALIGGGKALATFLLMVSVTVPAGVMLTLYEFSTFGH